MTHLVFAIKVMIRIVFLKLLAIVCFTICMANVVAKSVPNFSTDSHGFDQHNFKKCWLEDLVEKSENTDSKGGSFKDTCDRVPSGRPAAPALGLGLQRA